MLIDAELPKIPYRNMNCEEIYISVDVESSGPIPGEYSMLSIGACQIGNIENSFYIELKPVSDNFIPEALNVCGLSLDDLKINGIEPLEALEKFSKWIEEISKGKKPVFVAFHLGFDWSMINHYFLKYLGKNPFGLGGIDAESIWFGLRDESWNNISKSKIKEFFGMNIEHTHHALDDAKEQALVFEAIMNYMDR